MASEQSRPPRFDVEMGFDLTTGQPHRWKMTEI